MDQCQSTQAPLLKVWKQNNPYIANKCTEQMKLERLNQPPETETIYAIVL